MNCIDITSTLGCWSKADGTTETVAIVNEYRLATSGETVLYKTRYSLPDGTLITPAVGETVTAGECQLVQTTCKGGHYEQLTLAAGVAQTIAHGFGLTDPLAMSYSVRGVDGNTVGDWPTGVRFINQTSTTVDIVADGIDAIVDVALMNMECLASGMAVAGGGGGAGVDTTAAVISSNGSITVTPSTTGNTTTFDLSYANSGAQAAGGQSFSANTVAMADQSIAASPTWVPTVVKLANTTSNTFVNGTAYNAANGTLTIGETANYLVTFSVRFGVNMPVTAGITYLAGLMINGVLTYTNTQLIEVSSASRSNVQIQSVTLPIALAAGTTVQLVAAQNEASARPVYASRGTYLTIARMSGA